MPNLTDTTITPPADRVRQGVALGMLLTVAFAVRLAVLQNDLWLDEVWSVRVAAEAESPLAIFTSVHHDNNHYLNTLWLRWCGMDASVVTQRMFSFLTSIITVLLVGVLSIRFGIAAASIATLMAAMSVLFVQYGTEARGYAPALCCALTAHLFLRRHLTNRTNRSAAGFGVCCLLGVLSHLSFLQYYFAAVLWSGASLSADRPSFADWLQRMLRCHLLAVAGIGLLYVVDVRYLQFGGGPRLQAFAVLQSALSVFAGGPLDHPLRLIVAAIVVVAVIRGVREIASRQTDQEWKFFACLFLLFPVFRVVLLPPSMMFERYFLIPLGFAVIPCGLWLSRLLRNRRRGQVTAGALLLLFVAGNLASLQELRQHGRGRYSDVLKQMAAQSPDVIRVSSDHPFRNRLLLEYHARQSVPHRPMQYVELDAWIRPPQWMICHQVPRDADPPVNWFDENGIPRSSIRVSGFPYALRVHTSTAQLSGCDWLCYELVELPAILSASRDTGQ